jgi:hypothetical protein
MENTKMPPIRKRKKKMEEEKNIDNGKDNKEESADDELPDIKNYEKENENQDESWRDFG